MNEQLQQILTIQQAIAAAATAAVINSLLNPQQAAGLPNANALTDPSNDLQQLLLNHQQQQQQHHQQPHLQLTGNQADNGQIPVSGSPPAQTQDPNARLQELLMQLQQQAAIGAGAQAAVSPLALNLNLGAQIQQQQLQQPQSAANSSIASPINSRSPVSNRLGNVNTQELGLNTNHNNSNATTSNTQQSINNHLLHHQHQLHQHQQQASPIKKLKTRHQIQHSQANQAFHIRSLEATSKPQHSSPKNHHFPISSNSSSKNSTNSSTSSSAFMGNNVGLPRKLVRGQDVWLGRGAEQTRQILKCIWCGQSFRTLAEMAHHMKITQHYTNIVSQEQITSWRQSEGTETNNNSKLSNSKQSSRIESDDNHEEMLSEKFHDSDREDSMSNEEEHDSSKQHHRSSQNRTLDYSMNDSIEKDIIDEPNQDDNGSPKPGFKDSLGLKPLTRSRKRESDSLPSQKSSLDGSSLKETTTITNSSTSQQPQNQNSATNVDSPVEDEIQDETKSKASERLTNGESQILSSAEAGTDEENEENHDGDDDDDDDDDNNNNNNNIETGEAKEAANITSNITNCTNTNKKTGNNNMRVKDRLKELPNDEGNVVGDANDSVNTKVDNQNADVTDRDDRVDEQASETSESAAATTNSGLVPKLGTSQKGDTGDPLSALETMVEKSFDPRMRPGVANGGILQRLGIDEEVCPPWQHINYANWYAAATYGHPMAAAILAAGLNLQNGIKLSKNVTPKKNED